LERRFLDSISRLFFAEDVEGFTDSWVATIIPVVFGLLTNIVSESLAMNVIDCLLAGA
jgi:hypothetical protein